MKKTPILGLYLKYSIFEWTSRIGGRTDGCTKNKFLVEINADTGNYVEGKDGQLYYSRPGLWTHAQGKSLCASEGASLLIIESETKQKYVDEDYKDRSIWLALYDVDGRNQRYEWVKGDETSMPLGYTNWGANEPNSPHELCVVNTPTGKWTDVYCHIPSEVICQKPKAGKFFLAETHISCGFENLVLRCKIMSWDFLRLMKIIWVVPNYPNATSCTIVGSSKKAFCKLDHPEG